MEHSHRDEAQQEEHERCKAEQPHHGLLQSPLELVGQPGEEDGGDGTDEGSVHTEVVDPVLCQAVVRRDTDLGEVHHHHGSPGHGDALGDGAAHRDQPAGPVGQHLPEARAELQPGLLAAEAGGGGGQGGEVDEDEDEQEGGGDGVSQHVDVYVGQKKLPLSLSDRPVDCEVVHRSDHLAGQQEGHPSPETIGNLDRGQHFSSVQKHFDRITEAD